jgi:hypothetical protein
MVRGTLGCPLTCGMPWVCHCLHACPKHPMLAPGLAGAHDLWRHAGKQWIVVGKEVNAGVHSPDVLGST